MLDDAFYSVSFRLTEFSDAILQSIDLAVAAEELGADGAYFRSSTEMSDRAPLSRNQSDCG